MSANKTGETRNEVSGDLKDLEGEFWVLNTKKTTSSPIDDDLMKNIGGLINNKLPKEKIDGLTGKYPRPENCKLFVVPKTNRAFGINSKRVPKKPTWDRCYVEKCHKLFWSAAYTIAEASRAVRGPFKANLAYALVLICHEIESRTSSVVGC